MSRNYRQDQIWRFDFKVTEQGGLILKGVIQKEGVYDYTQNGQIIKEYKPKEEIFNPDSFESLRSCPITNGHPARPVNTNTYKELTIGHICGDITINEEEGTIEAPIVILDEVACKQIREGRLQEISPGFTCVIEELPGWFKDTNYHCIQRGYVYNHIAIGPPGWGRQGPAVAIKIDTKEIMKRKIKGSDGKEIEIEIIDPGMIKLLEEQEESLRKAQDAADPKKIAERAKYLGLVIADYKVIRSITKKDAEDDPLANTDDPNEFVLASIKLLDPGYSPEGKSPDFNRGFLFCLMQHVVKKENTTVSPPSPTEESEDSFYGSRKGKDKKEDAETSNVPKWQQPLTLSK